MPRSPEVALRLEPSTAWIPCHAGLRWRCTSNPALLPLPRAPTSPLPPLPRRISPGPRFDGSPLWQVLLEMGAEAGCNETNIMVYLG